MPKNWWQSRIFWLNVIAVLIVIVQAIQQEAWINPEYQVLILAVLNAIMRFLTSQPIAGTPSAKATKESQRDWRNQTMIDLIQLVGSLGVGAVFGLIVFLIYRQEKRATEKRLTKLLEEDQESRQANTEALTELSTLVKRLNGRLK